MADGAVIGRRGVVAGIGAATALGGARARAQAQVTVRAMTLQGAPLQMQAYAKMVAEFEQAHPGIKVLIEPVSETVLWPKLAAAYAGGDVPDLVLQATAPPVISLYYAGLLLPMDDVVKAVGEDDFEANARNLYFDRGHYFAAAASNNCVSLLWYRKDLLAGAGLAVPETWDQLIAVARSLTKGGRYGTALPYGKTAMTNSILWTLIYQAGGRVIAPDDSVVFASEHTEAALEFLKEMHQYCPPGANRYDFGDVLNAYVSGASATTMYTGRAIVNTMAQNPAIADQISCVPYPYMKGGVPWRSGCVRGVDHPQGGAERGGGQAVRGMELPAGHVCGLPERDARAPDTDAEIGHRLRGVSRQPRAAEIPPRTRCHHRHAGARALDREAHGRQQADHQGGRHPGQRGVRRRDPARGDREPDAEGGRRVGPGPDRADHAWLKPRAGGRPSRAGCSSHPP